jgi:hypothetical protein
MTGKLKNVPQVAILDGSQTQAIFPEPTTNIQKKGATKGSS